MHAAILHRRPILDGDCRDFQFFSHRQQQLAQRLDSVKGSGVALSGDDDATRGGLQQIALVAIRVERSGLERGIVQAREPDGPSRPCRRRHNPWLDAHR